MVLLEYAVEGGLLVIPIVSGVAEARGSRIKSLKLHTLQSHSFLSRPPSISRTRGSMGPRGPGRVGNQGHGRARLELTMGRQ